mgnify:CR=1 FL=1
MTTSSNPQRQFTRTCQSCGHQQTSRNPATLKGGVTNSYLEAKCRKCKSRDLDWGSVKSSDHEHWLDDRWDWDTHPQRNTIVSMEWGCPNCETPLYISTDEVDGYDCRDCRGIWSLAMLELRYRMSQGECLDALIGEITSDKAWSEIIKTHILTGAAAGARGN